MQPIEHGLSIIVADRGWVWVGDALDDVESGMTTITNARCIRRWGTDKGLGQLATGGPRPNTVLDTPHTIKVYTRAIIAVLPCEPAAWNA